MMVRFRRADHVAWTLAADEAVLLVEPSGELFELDRWATSIWAALNGDESVDEISEAIATACGAPVHVVRGDVRAFCEDLLTRGLVVGS